MIEASETLRKDSGTLRPFRSEDREAVQAILNRELPAHQQRTAAQWEANDARKSAAEVSLRRVIADPMTKRPVAYLSAVDLSTVPGAWPGFCGFSVTVDFDCRRQGTGTTLYALAAEFAQARGLQK